MNRSMLRGGYSPGRCARAGDVSRDVRICRDGRVSCSTLFRVQYTLYSLRLYSF